MSNLRTSLSAAVLVLGLTLSACAAKVPAAAEPSAPAATPATAAPSTASATPTVAPTSASAPTSATAAASTQPASATAVPGGSTQAPAPGQVDCAVAKCVALTFDDGPNNTTTLQVVDALTKANAPATFFMLGSMAQANPAVVTKIAANPRFEIGNHSVSHPNLNQQSAATVASQINGAAATISQLSGRRITLFRPPYGNHNSTVNAVCRNAGEAIIIWDVDTEDWKNRSAATTTSRAVSAARSGSIVLMHDIHPSTAAAVPGIIAQLRAKGFVLVTVSELIGSPAPGTTYMRRG